MKCINCGTTKNLELHHVVPLALGGNDIESNKVFLCSICHAKIHGADVDERGIHWKELQKAGIEKAKKEGKYKGRKKLPIDETKMRTVCAEWRKGNITAVEAQKQMELKPNTFYRRVKEFNL